MKVTVQHDGFEPAEVWVFMDADGAVKAYMSFSSSIAALLGQGAALPEPWPKTYYVGQHFAAQGMPYILAAVRANKAVLINTDNGIRWRRASSVKDVFAITEDEFSELTFGRVEDFSEVIK